MFDIQEELKKLPAKPGVYLMHNSKDEIIYVGKAIKLCNRVRQYFQDSRNLSVKIQNMVKNVAYFEYIITDSELEALVLENNLIKEHHPKYNTKLKDDKGYPYIKVTTNEEFPRIMLARKMKADGSKYFGPYTNGAAVYETINLIYKIFNLAMEIINYWNNNMMKKSLRYPIVIPIVIYTGNEDWQENYDFSKYINYENNGIYLHYNLIKAKQFIKYFD